MAEATRLVGVLLIYGLGGTQCDLGSIHKILQSGGAQTHTVDLPGHGGQPSDLLDVTAADWIKAVRDKYREIIDKYDVLHIVGMCMGALLATELVKREKHTKGRLVLLATPLFLDGWSIPWYRFVRHLLYPITCISRRIRIYEEEPFGIKNMLLRNIVKSRLANGDSFHYPWVPLSVLEHVDLLRDEVKQGLPDITIPTLIVHSKEDELTSPRSAFYLKKHMTGAVVKVSILVNSYHMICVDNERKDVAMNVLEHLGMKINVSHRTGKCLNFVQAFPMKEACESKKKRGLSR